MASSGTSLTFRQVGHPKVQVAKVGPIGYGLMRLTWAATETPDEQAFKAILTALKGGSTCLNSGEFYGNGPDRTTANLELLARFFDRYPEWAEDGKIFLAVKGGIRLVNGIPTGADGSEEFLRESVKNINKKLGGKKKMDLFEMARVDKKIPVEDVMKTMKKLIGEGEFKHVGLSEASAQTIRRAHAVHPISSVEVEYSPWCLNIESNGVLATCEELEIPIIAYSPLGLGMLTGRIKSPDDIPDTDMRKKFDRFQPENFGHNMKLTEKIQAVAKAKGCTAAQICLSWLLAQSKVIIPIPGSTRPEGVEECLGSLKVHLTQEELKQLREIIDKADIKGLRYSEHHQAALDG